MYIWNTRVRSPRGSSLMATSCGGLRLMSVALATTPKEPWPRMVTYRHGELSDSCLSEQGSGRAHWQVRVQSCTERNGPEDLRW